MIDGAWKRTLRKDWHWLALLVMSATAVWHAVDFSDTPDSDFPKVVRPHFNTHPPAAYRLAEPGDTLDRIGLYLTGAALALSLVGLIRIARSRHYDPMHSWILWPTATAISMAGVWYASTPGPSFDGWHGFGWRTILNATAPLFTRLPLLVGASALAAVVVVNLGRSWPERRQLWAKAVEARIVALLIIAAVLITLRQVEIKRLEPVGYWPRCAFDLGFLAFTLAIIRAKPAGGQRVKYQLKLGVGLAWGVIVMAGVMLAAYHRPISRLKAVVPGRIYISAMPTYRGLSIEQKRIGFKTIINLFDEASTQASPYHEDELRFVREHGLRYLGSPSDGLESDRFLDETFALTQHPDAWPILVHCHGCMDRSPAWMGMYRFLIEKKPLDSVFREIERHRGNRPKAVVTLQYNRKLPKRAPEQFFNDPTGALLLRCAEGTTDPFHLLDWNPTRTDRRVVRRIDPDSTVRRP